MDERQSATEPERLLTNRRKESKSITASPGKEMENYAKSSSRLRYDILRLAISDLNVQSSDNGEIASKACAFYGMSKTSSSAIDELDTDLCNIIIGTRICNGAAKCNVEVIAI